MAASFSVHWKNENENCGNTKISGQHRIQLRLEVMIFPCHHCQSLSLFSLLHAHSTVCICDTAHELIDTQFP